jgi:hypothetical protein
VAGSLEWCAEEADQQTVDRSLEPSPCSNLLVDHVSGLIQQENNKNITQTKSAEPVEVQSKVPEVNYVLKEVDKPTDGDVGTVEEENKAVDEPSKTEQNTYEKMEVVENGIDKKKEYTELPYKDDQWSLANKDGMKQYNRDFLMKLQMNPQSLQMPGTLPDNMEVILNTPALEKIKSVASAPNLNRAVEMNPQHIRSSTMHSITPINFRTLLLKRLNIFF